jgi:putative transposase
MYNRKIEVDFVKDSTYVLDSQSRISNWLYNQLLDACKFDYAENDNKKQLLVDDNLRSLMVSMKDTHPFLRTVNSSPLKGVVDRLLDAYQRFFDGKNKYPKFRSIKNNFFSLIYDEPTKGWKIEEDGVTLHVSLGETMEIKDGVNKSEDKRKNPYVTGKLREKFSLSPDEKVNTFRLCKQQGDRFYAVITIERITTQDLEQKAINKAFNKEKIEHKKKVKVYKADLELFKEAKEKGLALPPKPVKPIAPQKPKFQIPEVLSWLGIDQNHKNFFVGVDHIGNSVEWEKLDVIKYWDNVIDDLKSKRDKCQKKYRTRTSKNGNQYTVHSPRWNYLNAALNRAYHNRREQIKTILYTIAHEIFRRYDAVAIGNYTPTNGTAPFDNMKRSMLNQEKIGEFRRVLEWVAKKLGKIYILVDEHNTTKECCVCGHMQKKDPSIREFTCISCNTPMMRDNNSSVNMAKKAGFNLDLSVVKDKLFEFTNKAKVPVGKRVQWLEN